MITLNDDRAFEPFCYGFVDDSFVVSSESVSHRRLGGYIEKEFDGAEMSICSSNGFEMKRLREEKLMPDVFQAIYFGHVGSLFRGKEIFHLMFLSVVILEMFIPRYSAETIPNIDGIR